MADKKDAEFSWKERVRVAAGKGARSIMDRLVAIDPAGFKAMNSHDRRQVQELVATTVVDQMLALGTFLTAGGSEHLGFAIDGVSIKSLNEVSVKLTLPDGQSLTESQVASLACNGGKSVVLAFVNKLAFEQAKDLLLKAVTNTQTDWVQKIEDDRAEAEHDQTVVGAGAVPAEQSGEVADGDPAANAAATLPGDPVPGDVPGAVREEVPDTERADAAA